jgi:hypothetical protein
MVETSETQREELSRYILKSYLLSTEVPIETLDEGESVGMLGKLMYDLEIQSLQQEDNVDSIYKVLDRVIEEGREYMSDSRQEHLYLRITK